MTKKEDKELQRHVRWVQNSSFEAGMAEYSIPQNKKPRQKAGAIDMFYNLSYCVISTLQVVQGFIFSLYHLPSFNNLNASP